MLLDLMVYLFNLKFKIKGPDNLMYSVICMCNVFCRPYQIVGFISIKCFFYSFKEMILFHYMKTKIMMHIIIRSGMVFYMCGFSFTFYFLFCMRCRTCTVTGKSSKDKENVRLTGFDVIRERHNSNSDAPFSNSVTGPSEGVLLYSTLPPRFISLTLTTAV